MDTPSYFSPDILPSCCLLKSVRTPRVTKLARQHLVDKGLLFSALWYAFIVRPTDLVT